MYLKSLTLRGFKSFARPTTFDLEPGITAIVGPNGSGKSNVVDALAWVMGEQGAKSLRGSNMSDIIFAGTEKRSPLGRAQVELTIDNQDGRLPIDYSEVTISRTIFRGGGSEYAINRSPARLLDVQELLSDTGLGRQMHVIVGQGQLDAVLRANAEERRAYIDEAAGILKHRRRKDRALRKLESMDANLVRVVDLIEEISRQLKPLARQAKAATKAADVKKSLEYYERGLAALDLKVARDQWLRDSREFAALQRRATDALKTVQEKTELFESAQAALEHHQQTLQAYSEIAYELGSVTERLHSLVVLTEERLDRYPASVVNVSEASVELAQDKVIEAESALAEAVKAQKDAQIRSLETQRDREAVESDEANFRTKLQGLNDLVASRRAQQAKLEQDAAIASERQSVCEVRVGDLEAQVEAYKQQLIVTKKELELLDGDQSGSETDLTSTHASLVKAEEAARTKLGQLQSQEHREAQELSKWMARREALGEQLPKESERSQPELFAMGRVAQMITVKAGWENAVSALLQPFEDAEVIATQPSVDVIGKAVEESGRNLSVVYANLKPVAQAIDVVKPDPIIAGALSLVLQRCAVADDAAEARALLSDPKSGLDRVATKEGVVLTRAGIHIGTGGTDSVLLLQTQWTQADQAVEVAQARLEQTWEQVQEAKVELARQTTQSVEALTRLRQWDAKQAELAGVRAKVQAKVSTTNETLQNAMSEFVKAKADLDRARRANGEAKSRATSTQVEQFAQTLEDLQRDLDRAVNETKRVRNQEMEAKVALSAAEELLRGAQRQAQAFKARVSQLVQTREEQREKEADNLRLRSQITSQRLEAADALKRARTDHERAKTALALHQNETDAMVEKVREYRDAKDKISNESEKIASLSQKAEIVKTASEMRYKQAIESANKVLGVGNTPERIEIDEQLDGPLQQLLDDNSLPDERSQMEKGRDMAQAQLQKIGVVNPLALEEYNALQERSSFLKSQVADLEKSKADLLSIIRDMDRQIKESFVAAFTETKKYFGDVFVKLFPGGVGQLSLTDPDDPLRTGVEISARPAGKRITQMSLLSGGERSLAALAYLIAIFKARPSPFYIMDEVEAALDDVNLSRVLGLFEELRNDSQLLLVTHQKRTMEIADALYGVSMREGTTAVLSHRMTGGSL